MASPALPWIGAGLAGCAVAGALGWAGVFGTPDGTVAASPAIVVDQRVTFRDCPRGGAVGTFAGRDRVLAVAHDGQGWVAVRNPVDVADIVWLPGEVLVPDGDQVLFGELPTATCDTVEAVAMAATSTTSSVTSTTVTETTTTVPETTTTVAATAPPTQPQPTQPPATQPPATQPPATQPTTTTAPNVAPVIGNLTASPNVIFSTGCTPSSSTITVAVTDTTGVSSVSVRWTVGAQSQTIPMTKSTGNNWTVMLSNLPAPPSNPGSALVPLFITARDGQQLQSTKNFPSSLTVEYCLS